MSTSQAQGALRAVIDHITVTAPTLAAGAALVVQALGVEPQAGGRHPRMGTHNLLLRLGESMYLEVIAPDPGATPPGRPRWFGLDSLRADSAPSLSAWVARTNDIHASVAASTEPLGLAEPMSRGALNWLTTIRADGSIPLDGVGPALIEWRTDAHPASTLPGHGLTLARLDILHPDPVRVARLLASIGLDAPVVPGMPSAGSAPHLVAHIDTPQGLRQLSAPLPS